MGNKPNKTSKNFFHEIKETTAYRDFAIRMNQMISRGNIDWTIDINHISAHELNLYIDQIVNFYCFVADYLYEHSIKKEKNDKKGYVLLRKLINIITKLSFHMAVNKPNDLFDILWNTINYESKIDIKRDTSGSIDTIYIDGKEYIGIEYQLPIGLKLLISTMKLCFANGYGVKFSSKHPEETKDLIEQYGWSRSKPSNTIVKNRIVVLEFFMIMILIEKKFNVLYAKKSNAVLEFISHNCSAEAFMRSILMSSVTYQENGVLPYSGYFLREFWELTSYSVVLSLNLSLVLLQGQMTSDTIEWKNTVLSHQTYLINGYLSYYSLKNNELSKFLIDNKDLNDVLTGSVLHIKSVYQKKKTLLPYSYKQSPFINEMLLLLLLLSYRNENVPDDLTKSTSNTNIMEPLLIILDRSLLRQLNEMHYCIIALMAKLTACKLIS